MAHEKRGTYLPGYKTAQVKHHEWRTAENSAAYLLPTLTALAERNPQLSMLDVGAGSGTISTSLAKYIPKGTLTATDLSDTILSRAKELAQATGVTNITFQQADAYELPFADDSFDVTHTHQMLAHLGAPADALRELLRVTKPGGVVAVRESDLQMWCQWPETPGLNRYVRVLHQTHEAAGGSTTAGRQLVSWALAAGAKKEAITMTYGTWCFSKAEDKKPFGESIIQRCRDGEFPKKGLEMGIATEGDFEEMAVAWEEWMKADDGSLGIVNGEILIQK